jgi:coproporphyrinogen III oxidase
MKATLEFNLPEDNTEFELAVNGAKMHSVLWEMDQWLRQQYKYMPDSEYSEDKYNTFEKCREHLREIMIENGLNFD